jgi:putative peptidoglycan lipid II flippase
MSLLLASQLGYGAQTVLNTSNILGELVLGLFAMSMATVSLPTMSRLAAAGDLRGVRTSLATALRGTAFLAIPGAVGLAVLAQPIVAFLYQRGRFGAEAVAWTADTLPYQALGILFIATARISTQALNALKDYRSPAQAAVLGFACNIAFSLILMGPLGTSGIALANSLAAVAGLVYQEVRLGQALGRLPYSEVLRGWATFGLASLAMGILAFIGGRLLDVFTFHGFRGTGMRLFPLMAVSSLFYFGLLKAFRVQEAEELAGLLKRKLLRRRS